LVFRWQPAPAANAFEALRVTSFGAIYCHAESHINADEVPGFTGGAKLVTLTGSDGKICAADLAAVLCRFRCWRLHHVQPAAKSRLRPVKRGQSIALMNSTTLLKSPMLSLSLHMDGARFHRNAVVNGLLITWRAGVDVCCR